MYEERCFPALLASIEALSAAHTVTFLAFRLRGAPQRECCCPHFHRCLMPRRAPLPLSHLPCVIAGRGEKTFEAMLSSAGFAVSRVPVRQLHEEYQSGDYVVLRACRYDAARVSVSAHPQAVDAQ